MTIKSKIECATRKKNEIPGGEKETTKTKQIKTFISIYRSAFI